MGHGITRILNAKQVSKRGVNRYETLAGDIPAQCRISNNAVVLVRFPTTWRPPKHRPLLLVADVQRATTHQRYCPCSFHPPPSSLFRETNGTSNSLRDYSASMLLFSSLPFFYIEGKRERVTRSRFRENVSIIVTVYCNVISSMIEIVGNLVIKFKY